MPPRAREYALPPDVTATYGVRRFGFHGISHEHVMHATAEFLRRPALWADLISRYRGTITSGPNFAYALLASTLERAEPDRFDLSSLRVAINGAEPIDARDTSGSSVGVIFR